MTSLHVLLLLSVSGGLLSWGEKTGHSVLTLVPQNTHTPIRVTEKDGYVLYQNM